MIQLLCKKDCAVDRSLLQASWSEKNKNNLEKAFDTCDFIPVRAKDTSSMVHSEAC